MLITILTDWLKWLMYFLNERMGYCEEIKKPVGFALLRGVTGINTLILQCAKRLSSGKKLDKYGI